MSELNDNEHRIKYFPPNDFACGRNIKKVEALYSNAATIIPNDLNDAIEFYNIFLYFRDKTLKWQLWSESQVAVYRSFSEELRNKAFAYFNAISDSNLLNELDNLWFEYHQDFVTLFETSGIYKKISPNTIERIFYSKKVYLNYFLKNEKLTNHFGNAVCSILLSIDNGGEYIIKAADSENNSVDAKYYVPKCLTPEQKNIILENYLTSKDINLNYLNLLLDILLSKKIPPTLFKKYVIKKREIESKLFENSKCNSTIKVYFSKNQKELSEITNGPGISMETSYSLDWIEENLDYPTLLNNFIYMFEFSDITMRFFLPINKFNSGLLDCIFENHNSKIYSLNPVSRIMERNFNASMHLYYQLLQSKQIQFEKIIVWFFSEYLVQEFGSPVFRTHITLDPRSYLEKCHELVTNMDAVCKQFVCFAELGEISYELLAANSKPVKYENIKSLINDKYAYGSGKDFNNLCFALFSNQCMLHYVARLNSPYESFYELIMHKEIFKNDYPDYLQGILKFLLDWDIIEINNEGRISLKNSLRVYILSELNTYGFINVNRYSDTFKQELKKLKSKQCVSFSDTLFAKPEADFFNYYLNDVYSNGPRIRNLYAHGIEYLNDNENEHYTNYIILLRLMVLLMIKINDEFCLVNADTNKIHK